MRGSLHYLLAHVVMVGYKEGFFFVFVYEVSPYPNWISDYACIAIINIESTTHYSQNVVKLSCIVMLKMVNTPARVILK